MVVVALLDLVTNGTKVHRMLDDLVVVPTIISMRNYWLTEKVVFASELLYRLRGHTPNWSFPYGWTSVPCLIGLASKQERTSCGACSHELQSMHKTRARTHTC